MSLDYSKHVWVFWPTSSMREEWTLIPLATIMWVNWNYYNKYLFLGPVTLAKTKTKTKNQKKSGQLDVSYTTTKTLTFLFLAKKHMPESHSMFFFFFFFFFWGGGGGGGVSGMHARLLAASDRRAQAVNYRFYVTKNPNKTSDRGASVYIGKIMVKNWRR